MAREFLYIQIWESCLPDVLKAINDRLVHFSLRLDQGIFEDRGNRKTYSFRLDIVNGRATNNIKGSAVARDLLYVLSTSKSANVFLKKNALTFRMGKDFILNVSVNLNN